MAVLYEGLGVALDAGLEGARRQDRIAVGLYSLCHKHLLVASLSIRRMYLGPAARETRAAIESAAIARLIPRDDQKFAVFENGQEDERSEKEFKTNIYTADPVSSG